PCRVGVPGARHTRWARSARPGARRASTARRASSRSVFPAHAGVARRSILRPQARPPVACRRSRHATRPLPAVCLPRSRPPRPHPMEMISPMAIVCATTLPTTNRTYGGFLCKYPDDRLVGDATYWLGESMFQRQRFRDAAEAFLKVSTKYESSAKAPDALLRLGQSLAALGEKEAACASLGEVLRKFPR